MKTNFFDFCFVTFFLSYRPEETNFALDNLWIQNQNEKSRQKSNKRSSYIWKTVSHFFAHFIDFSIHKNYLNSIFIVSVESRKLLTILNIEGWCRQVNSSAESHHPSPHFHLYPSPSISFAGSFFIPHVGRLYSPTLYIYVL